jgi:hypothetical protein
MLVHIHYVCQSLELFVFKKQTAEGSILVKKEMN